MPLDALMPDGTLYAFTCAHCGTAVSESGRDTSGSLRCDDADPKHHHHTAPGDGTSTEHTECCTAKGNPVEALRPDEDAIEFARETLGSHATDAEVYDLAWDRSIRDAHEREQAEAFLDALRPKRVPCNKPVWGHWANPPEPCGLVAGHPEEECQA